MKCSPYQDQPGRCRRGSSLTLVRSKCPHHTGRLGSQTLRYRGDGQSLRNCLEHIRNMIILTFEPPSDCPRLLRAVNCYCQAPTQLPTPSPLQPNSISTSSHFNSSKSWVGVMPYICFFFRTILLFGLRFASLERGGTLFQGSLCSSLKRVGSGCKNECTGWS